MQVREVMSTDVVTVDVDATVSDAAREMLAADVGSVVVTVDGNPAGILTEYDATAAGYRSDRPFSEIPVRKAASQPLETVQPTATLRAAAERMKRANVKRLVVADGTDLVGVVSMTDFVRHHSDFARDARELERRREDWTTK